MLRAAVAAALVAGALLRVWATSGSLGALDGDEAMWTLMARSVLDGEVTAFFWGQGYGGTQEVLLTAPVLWATGTSLVAGRLVNVALTVVAAALVWVVGRRVHGDRRALVASALFWVWPAYEVWKSPRVNGFYASGQVLVLLVLLLVLRVADRRERRDVALLGLVLGLCAWQTAQSVPIVVPALGWLLWRRRDVLAVAWVAIPAFVLGSLPLLVSNLRHDWWSLSLQPGGGTYLSRLQGFFTAALPEQLGFRVPFTLEWLLSPVVGAVLLAAALGAFLWLLARTSLREPFGLVLVTAAGFPFVYALSDYTSNVQEPRYLFLYAPVPALVAARFLGDARAATAGLAAAVALSTWGLWRMDGTPAFAARNGNLAVPDDVRPVVDVLDRAGIRHAHAQYWNAARLMLVGDRRIVAVPYGPDGPEFRWRPELAERVRRADRVAFVVGPGADPQGERFNPESYRRVQAGEFAVYLPRAGS